MLNDLEIFMNMYCISRFLEVKTEKHENLTPYLTLPYL